jgi:hypothetical protein
VAGLLIVLRTERPGGRGQVFFNSFSWAAF